MIPAFFNWSGGKDSSLALWKIQQDQSVDVRALLTSVNAHHDRISMHGVRRTLLEQQAVELGLPLYTLELPEHPSMSEYETLMHERLKTFTDQGIQHAVFGDIFLEDLRSYREAQLQKVGLKAIFPLWKQDTTQLMHEFLDAGFKAIVVCVSEKVLGREFCGRIIDREFCNALPEGVDICGEHGEYHSFVFDGPIFKNPIPVTRGEIVHRTYPAPSSSDDSCTLPADEKNYGFYFCDLV